MKKIINSLLAVMLVVLSGVSLNIAKVDASNDKVVTLDNETNCPYIELNEKIPLVNDKAVYMEGTKNSLYWEFEDINNAFEIVKELCGDDLQQIQLEYKLGAFSTGTWKKYFDAFVDKYTEYGMLENEKIKLLHQFFTVCENHEINTEIMSLYSKKDTNQIELICYLPYTSPIVQKTRDKINEEISQTRVSNLSAAISYAKKYASTPNTGKYSYYKGKDCTNFVSQILVAGGYKTNSDWKPYTAKWNAAHNFVLYWYMKLEANNGYPSFNSMSGSLKAGNVIGADWDSDGRYNHCAFVVASGSKTSNGYYDVTIAQHSPNYCEKVSSSKNSWETKTKGVYVRLPF